MSTIAKLNGITWASIAKHKGIAVASIGKINGVDKPAGGVSTIYSPTLNADAGGWNGYTIVNLLAAAGLSLGGLGTLTQMRVTLQAGNAEQLIVTNAYISHAAGSGDQYDSAATPVQLLWSGSGSKTIAAGAQAVSDWASFGYNKTSNLLIAIYTNGGTGGDTYRYISGAGGNYVNYYMSGVSEAGSTNRTSGYTQVSGQNLGVAKIEVQ